MKINNKYEFGNICRLHNDEEYLSDLRIAGRVVSSTLSLLKNYVVNKNQLNLLKLNKIAEQYILDQNCSLTFKDYSQKHHLPFPAGVCISVNNQLVHGIPKDYELKEGDLVSFDLGATYNKSIADSAITIIVGQAKNNLHTELVNTTKECLYKAIDNIKIGNQLGVIGNAIYKHATNKGFGVITDYGGHGIDINKPHSFPFVQNKSLTNEGIRFQKGMVLAIEPMCCIGLTNTKKDSDGWTVCTNDYSAHFEHTIFIHDKSVEIITKNEC